MVGQCFKSQPTNLLGTVFSASRFGSGKNLFVQLPVSSKVKY